jgi:hypothetical protein
MKKIIYFIYRYSPPQVEVFPSVTSTYFTVETSSSVLPISKQLQQQQLILPKTAENIAAIAAIQQTEMLPAPAGLYVFSNLNSNKHFAP